MRSMMHDRFRSLACGSHDRVYAMDSKMLSQVRQRIQTLALITRLFTIHFWSSKQSINIFEFFIWQKEKTIIIKAKKKKKKK